MSRRHAPAWLVAVLVAGLATVGCTLPGPGCDLIIAATDEPDVLLLPADAEVLVRTADVDPAGWAVTTDDNGIPAIDLRLLPEAADRLATHTRDHVGGFLAIAVDGAVVSAPMIMGAIEDGRLQLTGQGPDGGDLVDRFRPCLPVEIRPPV